MVCGFLLHLLEGSAIHVYQIISTWPEVEHGALSVEVLLSLIAAFI
jgi:hypothetical protein